MTFTSDIRFKVSVIFAARFYPWYDLLWSWMCNSLNMLNIRHIWPLTLTLTSDIRFKISIMFAAQFYPWYDLLRSWTCNSLNVLNIGHIWLPTLTLTSGVKSKVGIAFEAKGYPWCGIFLSTSQQFVAFAQSWHFLATDLYLWGQIQGRHLVRSVKLPRVAPLLSCTRQIINITQFWFVRWPWPLGSNSRSLIRCNPWVVKNPHAENRVKILKIGGVVRARTDRQTDRRTDRQTHKSKMSLPYYPNRTLLLV